MELTGVLIANKGNDVCFEFKFPDSEVLEYYHIKTFKNGKVKLVFQTDRHEQIPVYMIPLEDTDNYWGLRAELDEPQFAVYDYKNAKQITAFLDEIRYQKEEGDSSHYFYYGVAIETAITQPDGTTIPHIHSSICGFLDEKGNLSSQIYDTESNTFYNSYMYGPSTLSPNFAKLVNLLQVGYEDLYYQKDEKINNTLSYLYTYPNLSDKPKTYKEKEKILKFEPRKKM